MKRAFCLIFFVVYITGVSAQKPVIDTNVLDKWPSVGDAGISNNGEYAFYYINNIPTGRSTLVIQSIDNKWKREIINADHAQFTADSRQIIYKGANDSLVLLTLSNNKVRSIPDVLLYNLFQQNKEERLVYQSNNENKELVIYNIKSGEERKFVGVLGYTLSKNGHIIVLRKEVKSDAKNGQSLTWIDLISNYTVEIWRGNEVGSCIFDKSNTQMAFITNEENKKAIWYYTNGMKEASVLVNNEVMRITDDCEIGAGSNWRFSNDGERLFFVLTEKPRKPKIGAVKVNVWHYQDAKLQSQQLRELSNYSRCTFVVSIPEKKIFQLTNDNERIIFLNEKKDERIIVGYCKGDINEWYWNINARQSVYLVSTLDGTRILIKDNPEGRLNHLQISPTGKYVVYYDSKEGDYYSYEIATGKSINITEGINTKWSKWYVDDGPKSKKYSVGLSGWMDNDAAVLINDRYDIWLVDPKATTAPINLTDGIGNATQTIFCLAVDGPTTVHTANEQILLKAFNRLDKSNGFYALTIGTGLTKLHMGPYLYGGVYQNYFNISGAIKSSKDKHHFLVLREGESISPNYFYTADFKVFKQVSNLHPEMYYNWLNTELYTYELTNGDSCKAVLYKPENFDPKRKYPVIIHFYDKKSDELHRYQQPELSSGVINIPYFVSNGYLVYTPDMHYEVGKTGESALRSVLAAVKYLSNKPWVDLKRMAVHGHSFGGYETNYIITHSNIFAAAISASGLSNLISGFGGIWGGIGMGKAQITEIGQLRIGCPPWDCPDVYVKNSPVFYANRVNTPILMMHNPNDGAVAFSQGIEFYTALRRCGKKVWLLEYEGEDHLIANRDARTDYTTRVKQFLDYYLKNAPAPRWMIEGIPAKMRGVNMGLELEKVRTTPGL